MHVCSPAAAKFHLDTINLTSWLLVWNCMGSLLLCPAGLLLLLPLALASTARHHLLLQLLLTV
jgi:hypothetical protein